MSRVAFSITEGRIKALLAITAKQWRHWEANRQALDELERLHWIEKAKGNHGYTRRPILTPKARHVIRTLRALDLWPPNAAKPTDAEPPR